MATVITTTIMTAFLPAPSGYVVNFENPQRRALPLAYWLAGVGLVVATLAITLRIYTRVRIVKDFRAEDWLIVAAFIFSIAVQAITLRTFTVKAGATHAWEMPAERYNFESVMITIAANLYVVCLALAKLSLLTLYHRMSRIRWLRMASAMLGITIIVYSLVLVFALIFACTPITKAWDVTVTKGTCINRPAMYVTLAVLNIATDVVLLIMPVPMVWKLKMRMLQKIGVVIVFLVGSITCVTSVVRLVLLLPILDDPDQSWAVAVPSMWVCIEANLVILCCSLPALRLFVRHFAPKLMADLSTARSRAGHSRQSSTDIVDRKDKAAARACSDYDSMDFDESAPAHGIAGYRLDEGPIGKGWHESPFGNAPDQTSRVDDATLSDSSLSDVEPRKWTAEDEVGNRQIVKRDASSVVSEP